MTDAEASETPLRAIFRIELNGNVVSIQTVGQAYRFITHVGAVEWMEFRSLRDDARASLEAAAMDAMLTIRATNALRRLFARAKLL